MYVHKTGKKSGAHAEQSGCTPMHIKIEGKINQMKYFIDGQLI